MEGGSSGDDIAVLKNGVGEQEPDGKQCFLEGNLQGGAGFLGPIRFGQSGEGSGLARQDPVAFHEEVEGVHTSLVLNVHRGLSIVSLSHGRILHAEVGHEQGWVVAVVRGTGSDVQAALLCKSVDADRLVCEKGPVVEVFKVACLCDGEQIGGMVGGEVEESVLLGNHESALLAQWDGIWYE